MKKILLSGLLALGAMGLAQESQELRMFYIGLSTGSGSGGKDIQTGIITEDGRQAVISSGGGMAMKFKAGFIFDKKWDISLSYFDQDSWIDPPLSNADGSFDRSGANLVLMYKFHLGSRFYLNGGLGGFYFGNAVLDIDATKLTGGSRDIYTYSKEIAPDFILNAQWFNKKFRWSFDLGLEYYPVSFDLENVTTNGFAIDPQYFSDPIFNSTRKLDGSSLNFNFGFAFHF